MHKSNLECSEHRDIHVCLDSLDAQLCGQIMLTDFELRTVQSIAYLPG